MKTQSYTHRGLQMVDIRRIITLQPVDTDPIFFKIKFRGIPETLSISGSTLSSRLCAHYVKSSTDFISRDDILKLKYCAHITDGFYYRQHPEKQGVYVKHMANPKSKYINFIDIESTISMDELPFFSKYEFEI